MFTSLGGPSDTCIWRISISWEELTCGTGRNTPYQSLRISEFGRSHDLKVNQQRLCVTLVGSTLRLCLVTASGSITSESLTAEACIPIDSGTFAVSLPRLALTEWCLWCSVCSNKDTPCFNLVPVEIALKIVSKIKVRSSGIYQLIPCHVQPLPKCRATPALDLQASCVTAIYNLGEACAHDWCDCQ